MIWYCKFSLKTFLLLGDKIWLWRQMLRQFINRIISAVTTSGPSATTKPPTPGPTTASRVTTESPAGSNKSYKLNLFILSLATTVGSMITTTEAAGTVNPAGESSVVSFQSLCVFQVPCQQLLPPQLLPMHQQQQQPLQVRDISQHNCSSTRIHSSTNCWIYGHNNRSCTD